MKRHPPTGAKGIFTGWHGGTVEKMEYFVVPDHSKNRKSEQE